MDIIEYLNSAGGDCIGCGFCCLKTKCGAGTRIYSEATPCPALKWNGERHVCDLMQLHGTLGETYKEELYAGEGCCSGLNSWRREPIVNRIPEKTKAPDNPIPPIMQKFLRALSGQFMSSDVASLTIQHFCALLEKDGMPAEQIELAEKNCFRYITENRSKFNSEFMG